MAPTYTTGKKLLVTKPPDMDSVCDRGFREIERWLNQPSRFTGSTATNGLPRGGTAGEILVKNSSTDYDAKWVSGGPGTGCQAGTGQITLNTTSPIALSPLTAGFDTGGYVTATYLLMQVPGVYLIATSLRILNQGAAGNTYTFSYSSTTTSQSFVYYVPPNVSPQQYLDFGMTFDVRFPAANSTIQFTIQTPTVGGGPLVDDSCWFGVSANYVGSP